MYNKMYNNMYSRMYNEMYCCTVALLVFINEKGLLVLGSDRLPTVT